MNVITDREMAAVQDCHVVEMDQCAQLYKVPKFTQNERKGLNILPSANWSKNFHYE